MAFPQRLAKVTQPRGLTRCQRRPPAQQEQGARHLNSKGRAHESFREL